MCAPKMVRQDFPTGKFRLFPQWSLWSGGGGSRGGGGYAPPPAVCGHSDTFLGGGLSGEDENVFGPCSATVFSAMSSVWPALRMWIVVVCVIPIARQMNE